MTSIQYLLFLILQGKQTNFRGHKLTQNKVHVLYEQLTFVNERRNTNTTPNRIKRLKKHTIIIAHVVVVVVDSHIQRIVLATEETTVTQQVSHRPIKRQSRLWSQRGTKVNGSHHGDNPLLRPTGIQIATKSYAALQAMAPTNIKTVHQTSLLHSRATSIDSECCRLPTTSVLSKKTEKLRSNQF